MRHEFREWTMCGSVSCLESSIRDIQLSIRLIGFEELGNNDAFTAKALEFRLQHSGKSLLSYLRLRLTCRRTTDRSSQSRKRSSNCINAQNRSQE
jgi:hypothetical protein